MPTHHIQPHHTPRQRMVERARWKANSRVWRLVLALALGLTWGAMSACRSSPAPALPDRELVRDDEAPEWTRRGTTQQVGAAAVWSVEVVAFDVWYLRDARQIDALWSGVYMMLDALRLGARAQAERDGLTALMTELEPGHAADVEGAALTVELTFVVARDASFEGVALRLWRALPTHTPTLTVLLRHDASHHDLSELLVWGAPGVTGAEVSALLDADGSSYMVPGLLTREALRQTLPSMPLPGVLELLKIQLWREVTDERYIEPQLDVAPAPEQLPADVPGALGLERRPRELSEILRDTRFPPRWDGILGSPY